MFDQRYWTLFRLVHLDFFSDIFIPAPVNLFEGVRLYVSAFNSPGEYMRELILYLVTMPRMFGSGIQILQSYSLTLKKWYASEWSQSNGRTNLPSILCAGTRTRSAIHHIGLWYVSSTLWCSFWLMNPGLNVASWTRTTAVVGWLCGRGAVTWKKACWVLDSRALRYRGLNIKKSA